MTRKTVVLLLAIALGSSACRATIERVNAPALDARIDSSDSEAIYVEGDRRALYRVENDSIRDVSHPGKALMIVGAIVVGIGAMAAIAPDPNGQELRILAAFYGASGAALFMGGAIPYFISRSAASNVEPTRLELSKP